jgi:hypothetical protein
MNFVTLRAKLKIFSNIERVKYNFSFFIILYSHISFD